MVWEAVCCIQACKIMESGSSSFVLLATALVIVSLVTRFTWGSTV